MSYRNDQFYGITDLPGETDGGPLNGHTTIYTHSGSDNPYFVYPERTVRTWEADKSLRHSHGPDRDLFMEETQLKRGYVRNIPRAGTNESAAKCQFQFNPQTIRQDVAMQQGLLNFYMQDPGQFAQPLAGNTKMGFTFMFDRTMEINNPFYQAAVSSPTSGVAGNIDPLSQYPGNSDVDNPWERNSPTQVGVLRDVAALYRVIGQGLSQADLASRKGELEQTLESEYRMRLNDNPDYDEVSSSQEAMNRYDELMQMNVGNYALLIPRPVRFMFSSLYMVEGYVTGTSVTFTKFNTAYVPIQCMVNVEVNAQHVGFAKEKTYVTYSIEQAAVAREDAEVEAAVSTETVAPVLAELTTWELSLGKGNMQTSGQTDAFDIYDADHFINPDNWYEQFHSVRSIGKNHNKFKELKKAFEDGASVTVQEQGWLYLNTPGSNSDSDGVTPVAGAVGVRTYSTKESLDNWLKNSYGTKGDEPSHVSGTKRNRPLTPAESLAVIGGTVRVDIRFKIKVTLNWNGKLYIGEYSKGWTYPPGVTDKELKQTVNVDWPTGNTTVTDAPSTPSSVGSSSTGSSTGSPYPNGTRPGGGVQP